MANTTLNLRVNAQFDELTQLNAEAQRSRDKIAAMEQASKILGKTVDTTDAAVEAHVRSLKTLQKNLDQNSKEYRQAGDELKKYEKDTKDATDATNKFGGLLPDIGGELKNFAAGVAAAFTIDAILNFTQALIDQSLVIKNYADGTGTSIENISRMSTAARKAGVDLNDLGDILKDINEKIGIIQRGEAGEQEFNLLRGLKQVGVEVQNLDGSYRDAYDILVDYGKATKELANDQELAKNATQVLENGNTQLLVSVQKLAEEQGKMPAITKEHNDAMIRLKETQVETSLEFEKLAVKVLPVVYDKIQKTIEGFRELSKFKFSDLFGDSSRALKNLEYEGDLKFIPPDPTKKTGTKLQALPVDTSSIIGIQQQITALTARLNAAVTDAARNTIIAQIEELKNRIAEMDGSAAKRREQEAERAAQKRQQDAEKLTRSITQYERDIGRLREGYERDIAKLRIDTLKQIQQMEADLQRQKRDAEMGLADAILRRDRAQQDRELYMRLRRGDITQQQFDIQTEANRFERENQDAVLTYQRERLEIQNRYAENVQKIADLEISHQQKLRELEQKRVDDMRNAAQRIADQGYTPTTPTTPTSPTTPTTSRPNVRREVTIQSRGAVNPLLYLPRNAPGITVSPSAENVNWSQVGTRHGMLGGINRRPLPPNRQVDSTNGVPVSLAARGVSQVQQLFALAQGSNRFTPFNQATSQIDLANLETGLFSTSAFDQLRYGGFSGYAPFRNPSMFGQYGDVSFAGLAPYPQQIMGVGLQTAQTNLQTSQFSSRFNYPSDLTNPQTGALATMQQEFDLAMRRFQLEQQYGQVTTDRYLKAEEAARLESQTLEAANQKLQVEIESGNYQGQTLESLRSELTINNEKIGQLQQLPGLVLQTSQAQQQKLELVQMERQLQADIANIISSNISQGIMNLIQGSQSLGEVLNSVVLNILNQILQKLVEMVIEATVLQAIMAAIGGGGGIFGIFGKLFGGGGGAAAAAPAAAARASAVAAAPRFANGGIMTADGTLPLSRYARGGIARSPQLAMFGEGSKPEAYVPLPDGRSIPVTIKAFADGGIYDPVTSGQFDNVWDFMYRYFKGMPDSETSRRYRSDAGYRDTVDKLINEYIGVQYSSMMDDVQGAMNPYALEETLKKLREQQPDLFADEQFSRYLLDQEAETFFTGRNLGYLQSAYGISPDQAYGWAARLQRQYIERRFNQEKYEQNYMARLAGGVYDMNYEPIKNRFAPNEFQKSLGYAIEYMQPLQMNQYAAGGIARSPQLAMFGEGALPEAFVPLPDGRSIPVSLMGSGGGNQTTNVNNISVNVSASGAMQQSDAEPQGDRLARAITRAVQEEIMRQQRPGGLLR